MFLSALDRRVRLILSFRSSHTQRKKEMQQGDQSYAARADAKKYAEQKFHQIVSRGRRQIPEFIDMVQSQVPSDKIIKDRNAVWEMDSKQFYLKVPSDQTGQAHDYLAVHPNGFSQAASKLGCGSQIISKNRQQNAPWADDLSLQILNGYQSHSPNRSLLRVVGEDNLRAVLSDSYNRLDTGILLANFMEVMRERSFVPIETTVTDTRVSIRMADPEIVEAVEGEPLLFLSVFNHSDFGVGTYNLRQGCMRMWCTNRCISEESFRKVHKGAKAPEEIDVAWSERTLRLQTETAVSETSDMLKTITDGSSKAQMLALYREADRRQINSPNQIATLKKLLSKEELAKVCGLFDSPDNHNLPSGKSLSRAINSLTFCAQSFFATKTS